MPLPEPVLPEKESLSQWFLRHLNVQQIRLQNPFLP